MATYVPNPADATEPVGSRPVSSAALEFRALKERVNLLTTGMGKNKIINGKMDIAQRGTSFAAVGSGTYTLDRWVYGVSGTGVVTVSQQTDVPSNNEFQTSLRLAVTTADTSIAAGDFVNLSQKIEGYNARDLIGRTFTMSFWVRSSKTGTHCVAFRNATVGNSGDRSYVAEYTVSTANTWENKSITVSGGLITAGANWDWTNGMGLMVDFPLAAGSTFQTTAGAWQTGNFIATANQVNCLDSTSNIFAITGVQLEVGSVATPFEHRPVGVELGLCQRYFHSAQIKSVGAWSSASIAWVNNAVRHPLPMRASPTITQPTGWTIEGITSSAAGFAYTADATSYILASANANSQSDGVCRGITPNTAASFSAEL